MERAKILVVDDESRMRKLVKDFLTREGYTVLEAGDGMEAMDLFYEDKEIALIILDVMMPKMDGWQVCREVRETSKVPIIMLTARSKSSAKDCINSWLRNILNLHRSELHQELSGRTDRQR